ncbi:MAG: CRISPR-associated endoribonuclease Cas6 [Candidatus Altiarchaeales archaeon HGW-Altiarchaeales-1]|nr:MAG: CRISPR-associated endoribonuclease Cas6 [Candidatus Altiarchaeales archaeon HGW-Altiarchaeales-1]
MRIIVKILPKEIFVYEEISKYFIHSFIWNLLKGTEFSKFHDTKKFKFFTFSNIFPVSEFKFNEEKQFIISSPNEYFIDTIAEKLQNTRYFKFGIHEFELKEFKKFPMELKQRWETSTPIVLYENNNTHTYYSTNRNPDLNFFLERLKDNALKKFNVFYIKNASSIFDYPKNLTDFCDNKNFGFEEPLFDRLFFKKQVAVHMRKDMEEFLFLGTLWEFEINLLRMNEGKRKFYEFVMECGLGEKNSLGFGFVNMKREKRKDSGKDNGKDNDKALMSYERDR